MTTPTTIAIVGSGHIGMGLGRAWARAGHAVVFGARDPQDAELVAACREIGARATGVADAAQDADVVVLAVPYAALDAVLEATGALAGKIVIDCTNAVGRGMALAHGHTTSAAEELQKQIPAARVFKSFNAQGAENLANPRYDGVAATNFFCGGGGGGADDAAARTIVAELVADVGFDPVDAGPLKQARLLEPMMLLWVAAAQAYSTRDLAFKLLRR
jgi:predicted dinucleotide-binding enzyme